MKRFILLGLVLFFTFSCMSTKAVRLGEVHSIGYHQITHWSQIKVYRSADQVKGEYEEVALLITTADTTFTSEKGMWNSMKKKASKLGANAIILDAVSEPKAGAKVLGMLLGIGVDRKGKAIAIYIYPEKK